MPVYDVNAAINKPDYLGSAQRGLLLGQQQRALREQRADQQTLRTLTPQVIGGDPGAYAQAAAIDPEAAAKLQGAGDSQLRRLEGLVNFMEQADAADPAQAQILWQTHGVPYVRQFGNGTEPTTNWAEAKPMLTQLKAKIAMAKAGQGGESKVHNAFRGQNGNMWVIDAAGNARDTGAKFDPNTQIIEGANGYYGVNKSTLQAAPVQIGQPGATQGTPPAQAPGAVPVVFDDMDMPPPVQQALANRPWTQNTPDIVGGGRPQPAPQAGGQLTKPAPQMTPYQQAQLQTQQVRTLSPEEVALRGYRPGSIVQVDGSGQEKVVQAPEQPKDPRAEADARKAIQAARAKVPQLQNAIRGLTRIDQALKSLEGGMVNTGPMDQFAMRMTKSGQELEAAVGGIQNSFLALTRVPGVGSQSDLEARIAALQYPSLDKHPEVNRRTLYQLQLFAKDLADAYTAVLEGAATPAQQDAAGDDDALIQKWLVP